MHNSFFFRLIKKFWNLKPKFFVLYITLAFYNLLWFINPNNYTIAFSFLVLFLVYIFRLKDFRLALLLTYLTSFIIFTGKTYDVQLVPRGFFPVDLYPSGYVTTIVISPKHIIALGMALTMLRDFVHFQFKRTKLRSADWAIILFFVWIVISDAFASSKVDLSLSLDLLSLDTLILYLYLRLYSWKTNELVPICLWLFVAIVFFESTISFQQFLHASPIYKSLEAQVDIEYFGKSVDEIEFSFRPVGTFSHANVLGLSLSFFLSVILTGLFTYRRSVLLFIVFLLGNIALTMTLGRSAWLGYMVSSLFILYIVEKMHTISVPKIFTKYVTSVFIIGFCLVFFFLFPRAEKSLYSFGMNGGGGYFRDLQIKDTLLLIGQNLFFGVGSGMSVQESIKINPAGIFATDPLVVHNWYLLISAEHGLPALIFFCFFVLSSIRPIAINIRKSSMKAPVQFFNIGLIGGAFALLIGGLFQPFINTSLIAFCFGLTNKKVG